MTYKTSLYFDHNKYIRDCGYRMLRKLNASEANSRKFCERMSQSHYDNHALISPRGEDPKHWNFILSGWVAASVQSTESSALTVGIFGPNMHFGECNIITKQPSGTDFVCLSAVEIISLDSNSLLELLDVDSGFLRYQSSIASLRSHLDSELLTVMKFGSPSMRVFTGLLYFAEMHYRDEINHPSSGVEALIEIHVKQEVIASICGVSRSRFSKIASKLAETGMIRLSYGCLAITNFSIWQDISRSVRMQSCGCLTLSIEEILGCVKPKNLARTSMNSPNSGPQTHPALLEHLAA